MKKLFSFVIISINILCNFLCDYWGSGKYTFLIYIDFIMILRNKYNINTNIIKYKC